MESEDKTTGLDSHRMGVDSLYPLLRLVARQYCSNAADAEDLVQEALLKFWKYGGSQVENLKSYLVSCIRNAAADFARGRQNRQVHETRAADERRDDAVLFECPVECEERRQRLESALAQLPVVQREVVVMKVWAEMTFAQIGEATEVSANTAASRYRYALSALRELLEEESR